MDEYKENDQLGGRRKQPLEILLRQYGFMSSNGVPGTEPNATSPTIHNEVKSHTCET